jgi:hypothetical protein
MYYVHDVHGLVDYVKGKTATIQNLGYSQACHLASFYQRTKIKEIFSISFCLTNISIHCKIFYMDLVKYIFSVGINYGTGKMLNT